jgi:hypothetical protein
MVAATSGTPERSPAEGGAASDLVVIREQTRETLELLRSLMALLLPKESVGDGSKLEDLIAALVAQQRDVLIAVRRVQADLAALLDRIDGAAGPAPNGGGKPNGVGRP